MGRMTSCMDVRSNNREVHKERSGGSHSRRSGFSEISGWVIWVLKIATQKCTTNFCYPIFQIPDISGLVFGLQNYTSSTSVQFKL
jgi:hypothetical protein